MAAVPLLCCILTLDRTTFELTNKVPLYVIFSRGLKATWLESGEHYTIAV